MLPKDYSNYGLAQELLRLRTHAPEIMAEAASRLQALAAPAAAVPAEMDAEHWAELYRLREAVKGPDGFATWQDAATDERVRRVKAERALAAAVPESRDENEHAFQRGRRRGYTEGYLAKSAATQAPAATEACALCSGNGFYGTPGQRCELCKGSRKAITPPAATEVPSDINWKVVGVLIEAHMTASRYHTAGTSNWGAALYKALRREFPAVGARVQPVQASLSDTQRLDALRENSWDLRCIDVPTGGDDSDIHWRVVEHHMAEPHERDVGRCYRDEPRDAIDAALASYSPIPGGSAA